MAGISWDGGTHRAMPSTPRPSPASLAPLRPALAAAITEYTTIPGVLTPPIAPFSTVSSLPSQLPRLIARVPLPATLLPPPASGRLGVRTPAWQPY